LDNGSILYVGPYGLELALVKLSSNISKLNSGLMTSYALYILAGLIIYLLFCVLDSHLIPLMLFGSLYTIDQKKEVLNSPPKPHPFISLPITSSFLKIDSVLQLLCSYLFSFIKFICYNYSCRYKRNHYI
jgi:hypothetical protein